MRARVPTPEVEEVLQAAAVRALERRATVREPERMLAWLYAVHRNVITDARKALRKRILEHCGVSSARECAQCRCIDEGCCA